jgi:hypothetical protein
LTPETTRRGRLFSGNEDRRNCGEKTRKIIQPEHPHGAPPAQVDKTDGGKGMLLLFALTCADVWDAKEKLNMMTTRILIIANHAIRCDLAHAKSKKV